MFSQPSEISDFRSRREVIITYFVLSNRDFYISSLPYGLTKVRRAIIVATVARSSALLQQLDRYTESRYNNDNRNRSGPVLPLCADVRPAVGIQLHAKRFGGAGERASLLYKPEYY